MPKTWKTAVEQLSQRLGEFTGRTSDIMGNVDCMLSYPGQTPQKWHMDGKYEMLGMVIFLTPGNATEFAAYEGKSWMHMAGQNAYNYIDQSWQTVRKPTVVKYKGMCIWMVIKPTIERCLRGMRRKNMKSSGHG